MLLSKYHDFPDFNISNCSPQGHKIFVNGVLNIPIRQKILSQPDISANIECVGCIQTLISACCWDFFCLTQDGGQTIYVTVSATIALRMVYRLIPLSTMLIFVGKYFDTQRIEHKAAINLPGGQPQPPPCAAFLPRQLTYEKATTYLKNRNTINLGMEYKARCSHLRVMCRQLPLSVRLLYGRMPKKCQPRKTDHKNINTKNTKNPYQPLYVHIYNTVPLRYRYL
jgi:hypothetical protein